MTEKQLEKINSIKQLVVKLNILKSEPSSDLKLVKACKTQESLIAYESKKQGIISMSLGSFKKYADLIEKNYFSKKIEPLRKAISGKSYSSQKIKSQSVIKVDPDTQRLAVVRAYNELLKLTAPLIEKDKSVKEDFQEHMKKFRGIIGITEAQKNE